MAARRPIPNDDRVLPVRPGDTPKQPPTPSVAHSGWSRVEPELRPTVKLTWLCLVASVPLLSACSAEPRFTLWRTRDGETVKLESGLDRQTCEAKRDRAETEAYAASDQQARMRRELLALGGKPGRPVSQPHYRCRPDGEE
jgi:hypothetical protein